MKAPAFPSSYLGLADGPKAAARRGTFRAPARLALLAVLACAAGTVADAAWAQSAGVRPVVSRVPQAPQSDANVLEPQAALNPPSAVPLEPAGNTVLAELRRLVEQREVIELRTTYNGQYGASLLFKADELRYYVALFQQRQFWRAIKTMDYAQAEKLYRNLAAQTEELAKVDIERIRLDAERQHTEQRIEREAAELASLRNNLDFQRQREREVLVAQEQAREQARALAAQEQAARTRLQELQRSIRSLEEQQANLLSADIAPRRAN